MDPVQPVAAASTATADLEDHNALMCAILEMQMDMECKKVEYSSLKIFLL
jgi:hypothetical protein